MAKPRHQHTFVKMRTPACVEDWQFQYQCSDVACGKLKDDILYGVPPAHVANAAAKEASLKATEQAIDLGEPSDVARIVDALFDNHLDWAGTVTTLFPTMRPKEAFALAGEWQADERVTKAIEAYVKSLQSSNPLMLAYLMHISKKYAAGEEAGAVKATAMNVLKSALVTEKSQRDDTSVIRVVGMDDIQAGITGAVLEKAAKKDEEEAVN